MIYCPANLAPAASSRTVVVIHDLAALRHPGWYSPVYASYQQQILPLLARRARLVIARPSSRATSSPRASGLDPDADRGGAARRRRPLLARGRPEPSGAPTGSTGPTCSWSAPASRARTSPSLGRRRAQGCASTASSWSRRARAAPTCARARRRRCARSATSRERPARALRRRPGAHHAVAVRGLRAARAGGHGQRRAGGGGRPHGAAGDLRRCRAARGSRRRRGACRRAPARPPATRPCAGS